MVELQIVILAVAGSSPVGHPTPAGARLAAAGFIAGTVAAKGDGVINPISRHLNTRSETSFWTRLLSNDNLESCENLEKLLVGCEIIAVLDDLDLLAA